MKKVVLNRDINVELLRVVLMGLIIIHHIIVHGLNLKQMNVSNIELTEFNSILSFINSFLIVAVNTFILISGYYGMKFNLKKICRIIGMGIVYSLSIYLIFVIFNVHEFTFVNLVKYALPIKMWWFFTAYILLMMFSPYINIMLHNLKVSELRNLIILLTILISVFGFIPGLNLGSLGISNGYSLIMFVYIYIIGYYLRTLGLNIPSKNICLLIYILTSLLLTVCVYITWVLIGSQSAWHLYSYNNILVVIASIAFFLYFKQIKLDTLRITKIISTISPTIFGVYLFHEHLLIQSKIYLMLEKIMTKDSFINITIILVYGLILFLVGILIEKLRLMCEQRFYELKRR